MSNIFNRTNIYESIFFNIQSVTEYPDLKLFQKTEPEKYETWERMAKRRYKDELNNPDLNTIPYITILNELYLEKACYLPEFSKIIAISYATVKAEDGKLKRNLKIINKDNELDIIKEFINDLNIAYSEANSGSPSFIPILCGHNIIGHDIPLLVKRIIKNRKELKSENVLHVIPPIIKNYLNAKPWDSNIIDTTNLWKFNGSEFISLNLVAEMIGLKKTIRLLRKEEINKQYWNLMSLPSPSNEEKETLNKFINEQSANFTNLSLQLVNEIRQL